MNARPGFALCGVATVIQIKLAVHAAIRGSSLYPARLKNGVAGLAESVHK